MLELLRSKGFKTVVCIDDENATPLIESIEALASALVQTERRKRRRLADSDAFFKDCVAILDEKAEIGEEEKKSEIRAWLEAQDAANLTAERFLAASEFLLQGHTGPTHERLRKELHKADVVLHAFSFGQWQKEGKELLATAQADARVLLLVDEVNDKEPAIHLNGQQVLSEILAAQSKELPFIDAIMVTSNCDPDGELNESQKVYEEISLLLKKEGIQKFFKKVFVLSKARLEDSTFVESFEWHLNRIEASRLSVELADATKKVLQDALENSLDWLKTVPLLEFHHSVFVTAANEGAAEIDTLIRLASIRQRVALEKLLREDKNLQTYIEDMRKFTPTGLGAVTLVESSSALRELREQEFERPGDHINLLRAPLACGDVFSFKSVDSKGAEVESEAMLLANPCDLVIRQDGKRKLTTGLIVRVEKMSRSAAEELASKEKTGAPLLYRLATGSAPGDVVYVFYNSKIESIPLTVLDICWTNTVGVGKLEPSAMAETFSTLTPPQQTRVADLIVRAEEGRFMHVELWGNDLKVSREAVNSVKVGALDAQHRVVYAVERKWRLAPEFAAAALSALSQSLARPAFGHDYLQH